MFKKSFLGLAVLIAQSVAFAGPDLVPTLRITGPAARQANGTFLVPVRVSVRNAGNDIAGRFKLSLEYSHIRTSGLHLGNIVGASSSDGSYTFDNFYAWSNTAIRVGGSISFTASIRVPKGPLRGDQIQMTAFADTCAGEEFMPFYCRVDEMNERNNRTPIENTAAIP